MRDDFENTYRYVNNDPVNNTDPSGLEVHRVTVENGKVYWDISPWWGDSTRTYIGTAKEMKGVGTFVNLSKEFRSPLVNGLFLSSLKNAASTMHYRFPDNFTRKNRAVRQNRLKRAFEIFGTQSDFKLSKMELLQTYRKMFVNDNYLDIYLKKHRIKLDDNWYDGAVKVNNGVVTIHIDNDIARPMKAALILRQQLLHAAFREHRELADEFYAVTLANLQANVGNMRKFMNSFKNFEKLQLEKINQITNVLKDTAENIELGLSIVNEGADLVFTINELSKGNYEAAVGLLPFVPGTVGKSLRKVRINKDLLKWTDHGTEHIGKHAKEYFRMHGGLINNEQLMRKRWFTIVEKGYETSETYFKSTLRGKPTIAQLHFVDGDVTKPIAIHYYAVDISDTIKAGDLASAFPLTKKQLSAIQQQIREKGF